jgi:secretion/DNA translocation related TadE-like protein
VKQDAGSVSVYALSAALLLAFLSVPVAAVAIGFAAHRKAVLAADLAALGGARASLVDETLACATAARLADANGARLQSCELSGTALRIEVSVTTSLVLLPEARATSRAGARPDPSG